MRTGLPGAQSYAPISSSYFEDREPFEDTNQLVRLELPLGPAGLTMGGFDDNRPPGRSAAFTRNTLRFSMA